MENQRWPQEKRIESRADKLSNQRAEFKFPGLPVYQLQVRDLSSQGVGIIVRADSAFLKMIHVGQELDVKLFSSANREPMAAHYKSRIEHVSELKGGRFKGHWAVGLAILHQII